jgi:hypothetical protein
MTIAILGTSLSETHGAFQSQKLLREKVHEQKDAAVPAGYQWQGMFRVTNKKCID